MVSNQVKELRIDVNGVSMKIKAQRGQMLEVAQEGQKMFVKSVAIRMPPMGKGWKLLEVKSERHNDEFYALDSYGNIIFWLPIEEYKRIRWSGEEFSEKEYHEDIDSKKITKVERDGGEWITIYRASIGKDGNACFVKGKEAWVNMSFYASMRELSNLNEEDVMYTLPNGADWDCLCQYLRSRGVDLENPFAIEDYFEDVVNPSNEEAYEDNRKVIVEWTSEQKTSSYRVLRGYNYCNLRQRRWVCARDYYSPESSICDVGFRSVLSVALPTEKNIPV